MDEDIQRIEYKAWLRRACFQKPTPEAYDLAWQAWKAAQQNAHPTLGKSADLQAVSEAETLSTSDGVPPSAPARVA